MTTISQRARDARLDKPSPFPYQAGIGINCSLRESLEKAVAQERAIVEVKVYDSSARKRDMETLERVRIRGYILGLSNENLPLVKEGLEAQKRLREDKYEKSEYRLYLGCKSEGPLYVINKTMFDYCMELKSSMEDVC